MRTKDPLENWLFRDQLEQNARLAAEQTAEVRAALEQLSEFLNNPPAKSRSLYDIRIGWIRLSSPLPPAELALAEKLYRRLYVVGGTGTTYIQEALLNLIAASHDVTSVPFWLEILDLSRPRDTFTSKRRVTALAALTYTAINGVSEAEAALRQTARHPNPAIRALTVHYWGRIYSEMEQAPSPEVITAMNDLAVHDEAFGPRFQARAILRWAGQTVPLDNRSGVYAFRVRFNRAKAFFSRTIEMRSEQTLDDLHHAIQRALEWDDDHLYSFFMDGERWGDVGGYRFSCPYEEDNPPWTHEAVLGELGLAKRHRFLYLFDYGDGHEFEIEVADIRPEAGRGKYPRVVAELSKGKAPEQYPRYED